MRIGEFDHQVNPLVGLSFLGNLDGDPASQRFGGKMEVLLPVHNAYLHVRPLPVAPGAGRAHGHGTPYGTCRNYHRLAEVLTDAEISEHLIGLQQNTCPRNVLGFVFTGRNELLKRSAFLTREINDMFLSTHTAGEVLEIIY